MKLLPIVMLGGLLITGLVHAQPANPPRTTLNDVQIRQRIVGTWIVDIHLTNGISIKGTHTVVPDGTAVGKATMVRNQVKQPIDYEAKWQVKDGFYTEIVTKTDSKIIKTGLVSRSKVISVDGVRWVYATPTGRTVIDQRSR